MLVESSSVAQATAVCGGQAFSARATPTSPVRHRPGFQAVGGSAGLSHHRIQDQRPFVNLEIRSLQGVRDLPCA